MKVRLEISPTEEHSEPLFFRDIDFPFIPPVGMYLELGKLPNGDIVAGNVTQHSHSLITGLTRVLCELQDEEIRAFAEHNGWAPLN